MLKQALAARSKGDYSQATFKLFEQAWQELQSLKSYAAFLGFQRDTGQILSHNQYKYLVNHFLQKKKQPKWFEVALKLQLQNLCAEYEYQNNVSESCQLIKGIKAPGIIPFPRQKKAITLLRKEQDKWREQWFEDLNIKAKHGIAVVGNSAGLAGQNKGNQIDSHGAVIRFNQPVKGFGSHLHFGSKTHTRVIAPGYRGPIPPCDWLVISGPDMQYQLQNWRHLLPVFKRGTPIITVPLKHWASLVKQLQAPPSAGLLMIDFLRNDPRLKQHIQPFGFGYYPEKQQAYHAADVKHSPTSRHRWDMESKILNDWFPNLDC
ncbi:MAG: glycosyltransferase family 29 protein [Oceanospirillaceae bacterium]|nr:glycosyltransferase family 29 protein [Oceanospirillaceae bacterium]